MSGRDLQDQSLTMSAINNLLAKYKNALIDSSTFEEMDMGIDERHCGLTSCQSQRPVLVLIPVKGIVTQNFKLQSFAFNQCSVLKETAFNKLISLKI
jgi:hypothetical protein